MELLICQYFLNLKLFNPCHARHSLLRRGCRCWRVWRCYQRVKLYPVMTTKYSIQTAVHNINCQRHSGYGGSLSHLGQILNVCICCCFYWFCVLSVRGTQVSQLNEGMWIIDRCNELIANFLSQGSYIWILCNLDAVGIQKNRWWWSWMWGPFV